jgi:hypothetical protein
MGLADLNCISGIIVAVAEEVSATAIHSVNVLDVGQMGPDA